GRALRVLPRDVERRALVEGQRDVRAKRGLDLHRGLGAHEPLDPVGIGAEAHAGLLDGQDRALAPALRLWRAGRAGLYLVGYRAVAHGEDLEPARIGEDGPGPVHERAQAAMPRDELGPGLEEQVE